jgi:hypothetical protein
MWMFKAKPSGQVDSARSSATVFAVIATPGSISTLMLSRQPKRLYWLSIARQFSRLAPGSFTTLAANPPRLVVCDAGKTEDGPSRLIFPEQPGPNWRETPFAIATALTRNRLIKKFPKAPSSVSKHLSKRHECNRIGLIVTKLQKPITRPSKFRADAECLNVAHC